MAKPKAGGREERNRYVDMLQEEQDTLFFETQATVFLHLAELYNKFRKDDKKDISRGELIHKLPYHAGIYEQQTMTFLNAAFAFSSEKERCLQHEEMQEYANPYDKKAILQKPDDSMAEFPFVPSTVELRWLKTMLTAPEANFMLPTELREKMDEILEDVVPFDVSCWEKIQFPGDDLTDSEIVHRLKLIFQALHEGWLLKYADEASGEIRTLIPVQLSYDFFTNRYGIITWDKEKERPCRLLVQQLPGLAIDSSGRYPKEVKQDYTDYLAQQMMHVELRLVDKNNARERCYALFSDFGKVSYVAADGSYHLTVEFYPEEREDVLLRIMSLGAVVTVLPGRFGDECQAGMRREILERWQKARELYFGDEKQ